MPELNKKLGLRFLQLVGILRWAIELGQLDIYVELSQLSQHQALPCRGHLEAMYNIFAYLRDTPGLLLTRRRLKSMNVCVYVKCRLAGLLRGRH
jgi:hypothetical protein